MRLTSLADPAADREALADYLVRLLDPFMREWDLDPVVTHETARAVVAFYAQHYPLNPLLEEELYLSMACGLANAGQKAVAVDFLSAQGWTPARLEAFRQVSEVESVPYAIWKSCQDKVLRKACSFLGTEEAAWKIDFEVLGARRDSWTPLHSLSFLKTWLSKAASLWDESHGRTRLVMIFPSEFSRADRKEIRSISMDLMEAFKRSRGWRYLPEVLVSSRAAG